MSLSVTNVTSAGASNIANYPKPVEEVNDTFSFDESTGVEQTVIEIPLSQKTIVQAFWLDLSNLTVLCYLRVYKKIDGSTYRVFQENIWTLSDDDGVLIAGITADADIKLTIQNDGSGLGAVDIPFTVL